MERCLTEILSTYKERRDELIAILQEIQAEYGYLTEEAMAKVAEFIGVSESNVFGVASFFSQFRFTPIGRKQIMVCRGTACHVLGCCALAPCIAIDGEVRAKMTSKKVKEVFVKVSSDELS